MSATMEEKLDSLLAMSREAGRLACELARLEHEVQWGSPSARSKNQRRLRSVRKAHERAVSSLALWRGRFLAVLPAEGAAS